MRVNRQFYDLLNSKKRINILVGGSRCFTENTKIRMSDSSIKNIEDIEIGDSVLTPNGEKKVLGLHEFDPSQKLIKFKFKNGEELVCTEDHEIWYKGKWVEAKDLMSAFTG